MIRPWLCLCAAIAVAFAPACALAWGNEGHEITALIAYGRLTPRAKARVDALLAADTDRLTAPDFASRATWADVYRNSHRETASWHFVDQEIGAPDLKSACFGYPTLAGHPASQGPEDDCVVDKIEEFEAELGNPATPQAEQIVALKFLMHFVGDVHQPLHASDHDDRGGNCILIAPITGVRSANLHAFWDTGVLQPLGSSPVAIAARLDSEITPAQAQQWSTADVKAWAEGSLAVAKAVAYQLSSLPTCKTQATVALTDAYQTAARQAAMVQLQKAGVRMAYLLNQTLGR